MSKDKILKVFELMDRINGGEQESKKEAYDIDTQRNENLTSLSSKIWSIIENKFPYTSFTSSDILEMYREEYNEPIKLDVVATYLSRYLKKGKLDRSKKAKECIYKVSRQPPSVRPNEEFKHETKNQVFGGPYGDIHTRHLNN